MDPRTIFTSHSPEWGLGDLDLDVKLVRGSSQEVCNIRLYTSRPNGGKLEGVRNVSGTFSWVRSRVGVWVSITKLTIPHVGPVTLKIFEKSTNIVYRFKLLLTRSYVCLSNFLFYSLGKDLIFILVSFKYLLTSF